MGKCLVMLKYFLKVVCYIILGGCRVKNRIFSRSKYQSIFFKSLRHTSVFIAHSTVMACCQSDTFCLLYLHIEVNEIPKQDYSLVPNKFRFANEMTYVVSTIVLNQSSWVRPTWVKGVTTTMVITTSLVDLHSSVCLKSTSYNDNMIL